MKRRSLIIIVVCVVTATAIFASKGVWYPALFRPTDSAVPQASNNARSADSLQVVASNLETPWHIAVLPDSSVLVTERAGLLKRLTTGGEGIPVPGVVQTSEGGLLGLALHPQFAQNQQLYVYLTTRGADGSIINRVERYRYDGQKLSDRTITLDAIPGSSNHDGGRIAFGPDGLLYVATGDANNEASAQDTGALTGKILRVTAEGTVPTDNPFGNAVYSYGHRNPQGLAWDDKGQLWATEHGRSGADSGYDELNRIQRGGNYGWPVIQGDETQAGMIRPVAHSGANDTWAPASLAYKNGSLYFGGLRGQALYEAKLQDDNTVSLVRHFSERYGRVRAVTVGPDDTLYFGTSNQDGRGRPADTDDRVVRVSLPL